MLKPRERNVIRQRVHTRIREKMSGTAERPRLNVYRSLNHIYTQLIDDLNGVTLVSASSFGKKIDPKQSIRRQCGCGQGGGQADRRTRARRKASRRWSSIAADICITAG